MLSLHPPLPSKYRVTSPFGYRLHPISGRRKLHGGQDYAAPAGVPILAAGDGVVTKTGSNMNRSSGYGHYIYITHSSSKHLQGYATLYAHMNAPTTFKTGDRVYRGEVIGFVGSTGASTGPHLHFELRHNNKPIDPASFMGLQSNHLKVDGRLNRETRLAWQSELKRLGKYHGVLDGIIGPMTIRGIQKWVNDGKIKYGVNNSEHFVAETGKLDEQTRRATQRKLNVRPFDGIWGRITISALQTHLNGVTRG
jgi:hypothetical protein